MLKVKNWCEYENVYEPLISSAVGVLEWSVILNLELPQITVFRYRLVVIPVFCGIAFPYHKGISM